VEPVVDGVLEAPRYRQASAPSDALPRLLDCKHLREELGVTRAAAEAIMRQLPVIEPPGLRKVYVRRSDVARFLEDHLRFK
jgi:hypothetical protein